MGLKTKFVVFVIALCILDLVTAKPKDRKKPDKRKKTKTNHVTDKIKATRTASGEFVFPDEMVFDFSVEGEYEIHAMSRKMADHTEMPAFDSAGRKHERSRKNQEVYADDNGAYQVTASKKDDGSVETDVVEGPPEISDKRKKRNVSPLIFSDFNPSRILKVVYVVDQAFMTWFRDLNNGNEEKTIEDASDYIYMLNNELTYMYRGIKEVSEASGSIPDMDIVVYAQGFYYPALGTEMSWLSPYISNNRIDVGGALNSFGQWAGAGNIAETFDTATFLTPRQLQSGGGSGLLGIAFLDTVCNPSKTNLKVSMNWDGFYDVALTAAHEWGHSLNSEHDSVGLGSSCPDARHIMARSAFGITTATQDTWNRWSTCSVSQIVNHVSSYAGCLLDGSISDDDFYDQLCKGTRGTNKFDVNYQCKAANKIQSSVACSPSSTVNTGKVSADACWDDNKVQCTNAAGACSDNIFTIFDGTPCEGTNSSRDYICYRGDCLEKVDICSGRSNDSTTSTPSTTPVTISTGSTSATSASTGVTVTASTGSTSATSASTGVTVTASTGSTSATSASTGVTVTASTGSTSATSASTGVTVTESTASTSPTTGVTVSSSPFTTTSAAQCSCRGIRRRRRRARCCRNQRTNEGTCCRGCRPNRRGTNCIPRRR